MSPSPARHKLMPLFEVDVCNVEKQYWVICTHSEYYLSVIVLQMIVNVKLERDSGGEDNIKSWIAKLPSDEDVSICCYGQCDYTVTSVLVTGCLLCCNKENLIVSPMESNGLEL